MSKIESGKSLDNMTPEQLKAKMNELQKKLDEASPAAKPEAKPKKKAKVEVNDKYFLIANSDVTQAIANVLQSGNCIHVEDEGRWYAPNREVFRITKKFIKENPEAAPAPEAKPAKPVKLSPNDKKALRILWSCFAPNTGVGLLKDLNDAAEAARLDRLGLISTYASMDSDSTDISNFKFTDLGKSQYVDFSASNRLVGDPEPAKPTKEEKQEKKEKKAKTPTKKAQRENDVEKGVNVKAGLSVEVKPWMEDSIPAKLARLADREVMHVRHVICYGNFLERIGVEPAQITEDVLVRAEAIERMWKHDLMQDVERYNKRVREINEKHGHVTTAPQTERKLNAPAKPVTTTEAKPAKAKSEEPKKVSKYPCNLGSEDRSVTSVIRWMGAMGYNETDAHKLLKALGIDGVSPATVKTQVYRGSKGQQEVPELSDDEIEVLESVLAEDKPKAKKAKK